MYLFSNMSSVEKTRSNNLSQSAKRSPQDVNEFLKSFADAMNGYIGNRIFAFYSYNWKRRQSPLNPFSTKVEDSAKSELGLSVFSDRLRVFLQEENNGYLDFNIMTDYSELRVRLKSENGILSFALKDEKISTSRADNLIAALNDAASKLQNSQTILFSVFG